MRKSTRIRLFVSKQVRKEQHESAPTGSSLRSWIVSDVVGPLTKVLVHHLASAVIEAARGWLS